MEDEPIKLHSRSPGINLYRPPTNAVVYILPGLTLGIRTTVRAGAKRTFEAHELMLQGYYALRFGRGNPTAVSNLIHQGFTLQHCLRPPGANK